MYFAYFLSTVTFYENKIEKAIRNLDPNKAHGHYMLSIRMLRICDDSLCGPLRLIFQSCFENGKFAFEWKNPMLLLLIRKTKNNWK